MKDLIWKIGLAISLLAFDVVYGYQLLTAMQNRPWGDTPGLMIIIAALNAIGITVLRSK